MEEAGSPDLKPPSSENATVNAFAGKSGPMNIISNVAHLAHATRTAYSRTETSLNTNHLQLLENSAISPEVSRARGYQTVTRRSTLRGYGFSPEQCRPPALLIPVYDGRGRLITYQMRPDEPRIDAIRVRSNTRSALDGNSRSTRRQRVRPCCPTRELLFTSPTKFSRPTVPRRKDFAVWTWLVFCRHWTRVTSQDGSASAIGTASFWIIGWYALSTTPTQRNDRKRYAPSRLCRNSSGPGTRESSTSVSNRGNLG